MEIYHYPRSREFTTRIVRTRGHIRIQLPTFLLLDYDSLLANSKPFLYFHYQVGSSNSLGGGIVVSKVADGGPASKEDGLKVQDKILKVSARNFRAHPPLFISRVLRDEPIA